MLVHFIFVQHTINTMGFGTYHAMSVARGITWQINMSWMFVHLNLPLHSYYKALVLVPQCTASTVTVMAWHSPRNLSSLWASFRLLMVTTSISMTNMSTRDSSSLWEGYQFKESISILSEQYPVNGKATGTGILSILPLKSIYLLCNVFCQSVF